MKTTTSFLTIAFSIAAPSVAAWLIAGQTFSTEIFFSSYILVGLFYIAATDYAPRKALALPFKTTATNMRWIRRLPARKNQSICCEKIAA
jgi:hypothetical protein